jgi:type VI protein secretion system component VasF
MKKSLFILSEGPVIHLKELSDLRHSVAFRLTVWYTAVFAVSLAGTFLAFYMLILHGTHVISSHVLSELREAFRHYLGAPKLPVRM